SAPATHQQHLQRTMAMNPELEKGTDVPPLVFDADGSQAEALFHTHQQAIYKRTDRMFAYLMGVQWLAGIAFALFVAPVTWIGSTSQVHVHVWAALVLGGIISIFPAGLA